MDNKLLEVVREAIRGRGINSDMSPEAFESLIISKIESSSTKRYIIQARDNSAINAELIVWGNGKVGVFKNRGMTILLVEEKIDNDLN